MQPLFICHNWYLFHYENKRDCVHLYNNNNVAICAILCVLIESNLVVYVFHSRSQYLTYNLLIHVLFVDVTRCRVSSSSGVVVLASGVFLFPHLHSNYYSRSHLLLIA